VYSFGGVIIVVLFHILINNILSIIVLLAIIVLPSLACNPSGYRRLGNYRATISMLARLRKTASFPASNGIRKSPKTKKFGAIQHVK
jgi:hypothetical protein